MPFNPDILRAVRARKRLSQGELAKASGVSRGTIINLEKPGADGKISSLENIAKALGVDESVFFSQTSLVN